MTSFTEAYQRSKKEAFDERSLPSFYFLIAVKQQTPLLCIDSFVFEPTAGLQSAGTNASTKAGENVLMCNFHEHYLLSACLLNWNLLSRSENIDGEARSLLKNFINF